MEECLSLRALTDFMLVRFNLECGLTPATPDHLRWWTTAAKCVLITSNKNPDIANPAAGELLPLTAAIGDNY
jgi:hypothetical protein